MIDAREAATELLDYWLGPLDDEARLDPETEPFSTHYQRWYGKDPDVDAAIRARFEPALRAITGSAEAWRRAEDAVIDDPRASLAITPRARLRNTPWLVWRRRRRA